MCPVSGDMMSRLARASESRGSRGWPGPWCSPQCSWCRHETWPGAARVLLCHPCRNRSWSSPTGQGRRGQPLKLSMEVSDTSFSDTTHPGASPNGTSVTGPGGGRSGMNTADPLSRFINRARERYSPARSCCCRSMPRSWFHRRPQVIRHRSKPCRPDRHRPHPRRRSPGPRPSSPAHRLARLRRHQRRPRIP